MNTEEVMDQIEEELKNSLEDDRKVTWVEGSGGEGMKVQHDDMYSEGIICGDCETGLPNWWLETKGSNICINCDMKRKGQMDEEFLKKKKLEDRVEILDLLTEELSNIIVEAVRDQNQKLDSDIPRLLENFKLERKLILRLLQKL